MKSTGRFTIRKIAVKDHGCHYVTFLVEGYSNGHRIRKKFQRHEEALGEKARLEIESGNAEACRAANVSSSANASFAAVSWASRSRVSPRVMAMTETDFWALHWKSRNLTRFGLSLGVSLSPSGHRLFRRFSKDLSPAWMSPSGQVFGLLDLSSYQLRTRFQNSSRSRPDAARDRFHRP